MSAEMLPDIKIMDKVRLTSDPSVVGLVCGITSMGPVIRYDVFINGETRIFYSGQLLPFIEENQATIVSPSELQSLITASLIKKPTSESLYSMNSGRIDFIPYQFRPVLKLLKSDEPRILIADSVGVGKTIEAGLIIKELEAQKQIEKILIICPRPLVAEEKWNKEMERFDEYFVSVDKQALLRLLDQNNRDGIWPVHSQKLVIPYSIMDEQLYQGTEEGAVIHTSLQQLDPPPHFDLVVIDEAHHIRNGSMEKEKAYGYKCVRYFCEHSDAVVMLTATPIQNSDHDLFTLLNVLRPDIVVSPSTFDEMSKPNGAITECAHILRSQDEDWQNKAKETLAKVCSTEWGKKVTVHNPPYDVVLNTLNKCTITREERVELIHEVESLHSFDCMINRTRRRDIQDFCVRRTNTVSVRMTDVQRSIFKKLLQFEEIALSIMHGDRGILFMTSTIRRQAASCIFGLAPFLKSIIDRRLIQLDGEDVDSVHPFMSKLPTSVFIAAQDLIKAAKDLPTEDPKAEALLGVVREVNQRRNNKIILFSSFRHTLGYLFPILERAGLRVAQVDGSIDSAQRLTIRKRFELDRQEEQAFDILLFTEVGSEGLDYQFCDTIINYDLPWNPMRIEQRIGRIDRRGQKSDVVHIYNMITEGTIDADIYDRCLWRIGVFERSIGDCEAILGEITTQIEKAAYSRDLSREELQEKLEQIADNEVRQVQELARLEDAQKDLFGIMLSEKATSQEIREAENPWLSPLYLRNLVTQYMMEYVTEGRDPFTGQGDVLTIMLSNAQRTYLLSEIRKIQRIPEGIKRPLEVYLKGNERYHHVTFVPDASSEKNDLFILNAVHPFVRLAASVIMPVSNALAHISVISEEIDEGDYPFELYSWQYSGFKWRTRIVPVCLSQIVEKKLVSLLQDSKKGDAGTTSTTTSIWDELESVQIARWQEERSKEVSLAQRTAAYRIGTLRTNSSVKQNMLKSNVAQFEDNDRMKRMYQSMLETEQEKLEERIQAIEKTLASTDIQTTLLAKGIVSIRRPCNE